MKGILIALLIVLMISSLAMADVFTLAAWNDRQPPLFTDCGLILWTSPADGTVAISGNAWPYSSTQSVWVEYVPAAIAALGLNPGNVLQSGTTPLINGTVQYPYQQPGQPAAFGSTSIPIRVSGQTSMPLTWPVQKGDVIAAMTQQYNMLTGDTATLNLNVSMSTDFLGSGGTLSSPQSVTGRYYGFSGSLKPGDGHSVDAYAFNWPTTGDLSGTAMTQSVFNGSGADVFQNGLKLELYSDGNLVASTTVLDSATLSDFDFGSQPAGNYVLQLTDLNATDDPPYNIELNGPIDPPAATPEPATVFLLVSGLACLAARRSRSHARRPGPDGT